MHPQKVARYLEYIEIIRPGPEYDKHENLLLSVEQEIYSGPKWNKNHFLKMVNDNRAQIQKLSDQKNSYAINCLGLYEYYSGNEAQACSIFLQVSDNNPSAMFNLWKIYNNDPEKKTHARKLIFEALSQAHPCAALIGTYHMMIPINTLDSDSMDLLKYSLLELRKRNCSSGSFMLGYVYLFEKKFVEARRMLKNNWCHETHLYYDVGEMFYKAGYLVEAKLYLKKYIERELEPVAMGKTLDMLESMITNGSDQMEFLAYLVDFINGVSIGDNTKILLDDYVKNKFQDRNIMKIFVTEFCSVKNLRRDVKKLRKENRNMKLELKFRPEGSGFHEAKDHFISLMGP
ncbi:MAG: hypothetical protein Hyperionvirus4_85 [Hyperionvirus sp.]|uniref:Tetratricopeptide repeat protein n=1 Tax=Hyperionvirus sp. TaxID=2487770 RepID=A0A3G5A780_9VIRU|nr:MAG: hypothetical protein Hyperionvirus4_85 [Hyperionvirus sp.]